MEYLFRPATEALLRSGGLQQVFNAAGQALPIARNPVTGQFAEIAVGVAANGTPLRALVAPVQAVTGIANIAQTHQGFQAVLGQLGTIQTTLGTLQATTAFIGVGTVATLALSAVNLHQTLKLREDVKQLRLDMHNGFLDLKQALKVQGEEIAERISEIPEEVEFRAHKQTLIQAYGRFTEANSRIKTAMSIQDKSSRNAELTNIRQTLGESLGDYQNSELLSQLSAPGKLRRYECAWAIAQAIAIIYQLQDELSALSDYLHTRRAKMCDNMLDVINSCECDLDIDFVFPEILRIRYHDLEALKAWQEQVDWVRSLSPSDRELLQSADFDLSETEATSDIAITISEVPPEQTLYETLSQKSHFWALKDYLRFAIAPEHRQTYETYVREQATAANTLSLVSANLSHMSDLAVANLYWYFKVRDGAEETAA